MAADNSPLSDQPFSYTATRSGKVLISHRGKQVKILQGSAATRFLGMIEKVPALEAQRQMASATGQYKFGNERAGKAAQRRKQE